MNFVTVSVACLLMHAVLFEVGNNFYNLRYGNLVGLKSKLIFGLVNLIGFVATFWLYLAATLRVYPSVAFDGKNLALNFVFATFFFTSSGLASLKVVWGNPVLHLMILGRGKANLHLAHKFKNELKKMKKVEQVEGQVKQYMVSKLTSEILALFDKAALEKGVRSVNITSHHIGREADKQAMIYFLKNAGYRVDVRSRINPFYVLLLKCLLTIEYFNKDPFGWDIGSIDIEIPEPNKR
ncbi:hypothetical protein LRP52_35880 [Photobacterium sp. ZSDE20]|uniref:Uncharacterized protein n=1 Tax=Photobacterium pectinilyticum TaxID=2906793 RepID=A0ABT1N5T1_9GAMM|nr:hypothetical protein [Photobacterium sp. ZSDE20]MCQ1060109.1 hypothetical protein [Photobacterium sp. ZSDE20]MDD1827565.1 hypothetical protein [Photobacterium sp. ZSDE20]